MRARYWLLKLLAVAIAGSAIALATAQEPQKQSPEKPTESAQGNSSESKKKNEDVIVCVLSTFLTAINVTVTDGNDQPITDLRREDFAIAEDGVKQQVEFLVVGDSPVSVGLAFDISDIGPLKLL